MVNKEELPVQRAALRCTDDTGVWQLCRDCAQQQEPSHGWQEEAYSDEDCECQCCRALAEPFDPRPEGPEYHTWG